MGMFNWALKGVRFEKRETQTNDVQMHQAPHVPLHQPQEAPQVEQISSQRAVATSILYPRTDTMQSMPTPMPDNNNYGGHFNNAFGGQTLTNRNILVSSPRNKHDVTVVVENLKHGDPCIICLDDMPVADAQRQLDFLSGVICALGGDIRALDANKYILTPSGVGVRQ